MHELSIAMGLVDIAREEAAQAGAERVVRVCVRIGALSGVVPDALAFAFDVATADTPLEGARLEIEAVPVVLYCAACRAEKRPASGAGLGCPDCGAVTPEVRRGRELEMTAIELS